MTEAPRAASPHGAPTKQELDHLLNHYPDAMSQLEKSTLGYYYGAAGYKKISVAAALKILKMTEREYTFLRERAMRKLYMIGYRDLMRPPPSPPMKPAHKEYPV